MDQQVELLDGFAKLRSILKKYEKRCAVDIDYVGDYFLNFKLGRQEKKPTFFAATSVNKITVSYYLMPVHLDAGLRAMISPELKRHLSGQCCFRFRKSDPAMFRELAHLTSLGFSRHTTGHRQ